MYVEDDDSRHKSYITIIYLQRNMSWWCFKKAKIDIPTDVWSEWASEMIVQFIDFVVAY